MRSYTCRVVIAAPVTTVYEAITTQNGLQGWWTTTCDVAGDVGEESIFRFGYAHNVMRIERLQPGKEVRWHCVERHRAAPGELASPDEWAGTTVVFHLVAQSPTSTVLEFEHCGLNPELECYTICERCWDHFLKRSLKNYLETGEGQPYVDPPS